MEPTPSRPNPLLYVGILVVILLALAVAWLNTPHQDSTEKPLPRKQEEALRNEAVRANRRADSLQAVSDTAVVHSLEAYAQGVQDGKEAAALKLETHSSPKPHAQLPPTPASAKQLQQYFNEY
jgi:hypothetical protein